MEKETMVATVPQAEIVDEQQLSRDVTDIEFQAESLVIQTNEDYAFAGEFGKMLKKKASQVTTFFKPMKDSAYQAHKAVCDREKAMLTPLRNAEKTVKQVNMIPRFKKHPGKIVRGGAKYDADTQDVLEEFGYSEKEIELLYEKGVLRKGE